MSKRFIAMCLTVVFLLGVSVNIFAATEEAVPVSGVTKAEKAAAQQMDKPVRVRTVKTVQLRTVNPAPVWKVSLSNQ